MAKKIFIIIAFVAISSFFWLFLNSTRKNNASNDFRGIQNTENRISEQTKNVINIVDEIQTNASAINRTNTDLRKELIGSETALGDIGRLNNRFEETNRRLEEFISEH